MIKSLNLPSYRVDSYFWFIFCGDMNCSLLSGTYKYSSFGAKSLSMNEEDVPGATEINFVFLLSLIKLFIDKSIGSVV